MIGISNPLPGRDPLGRRLVLRRPSGTTGQKTLARMQQEETLAPGVDIVVAVATMLLDGGEDGEEEDVVGAIRIGWPSVHMYIEVCGVV